MSKSFGTFNPRCEVTLHKTVARKTVDGQVAASARFTGAQTSIDLTSWISDEGSVRTTKSVRAAAGGFSVTLTDRMSNVDFDSMYGLIEPMDLIVIRMARSPGTATQRTADNKLPVIMRGFVSRVDRSETMSPEGRPSRQVVVSGQDYGKLWQILQIFYAYNYPLGATLLTQWSLFTKYGVGFQNQGAADFVRQCISKILNPFVDQVRKHGNTAGVSPILPVSVSDADITVTDGMVAPFGINQWQGGTLHSLLEQFGDVGAWNELFLEDRQTSVNLVYRPNPYYDAEGSAIMPGIDPKVVAVDASECTEISVARSDSDVSNYYWVESARSNLIYGPQQRLLAAQSALSGGRQTFYITDHNNCDPNLYGLRKMTVRTNEGSPLEEAPAGGGPAPKHQQSMQYSAQWLTDRRERLVHQNWDNVVFESGTITLRGNENVTAGSYIELTRGSLKSRYYVVSVDQEYVPFNRYQTKLTVERGTGFIERIQRGAGKQSPWLSELAGKP